MGTQDKQTTPDLDEMMVQGTEVLEIPTGPDVEPTAAQPAPGIKAEDELSEEEGKKKKELRFKTHEEAEEGYKEKQARVTKVEQENADLRKAVAEHEEAMKKLTEQEEAAKAEEKQAAVEKKIFDYSRQRHEETLKAIEDLDPEDPDHSTKVADLWAKIGADIRKFEKEAAHTPLEEPEKKPAEEKPGEEEQAEAKPAPDDSEFKSDAEARSYVEDKVKAAGRDFTNPVLQRTAMYAPQNNDQGVEMTLDDQISWAMENADRFTDAAKAEGIDPEDPVYLHMVFKAPMKNDEGEVFSLDDQMQHALEETKKYKAAEKSRILQEANLPLSTGGPDKPGPNQGKPEQGISFGSAIDKAVESRRL